MSLTLFDEAPASGTFRILTVCTGNICRSPLAESLLRQSLRDVPVEAASAGTHALVGEGMSQPNQVIARELGVADAADHRARQLTADMLEQSDLVLALSREHRREVVSVLPRASRYAFTLREFARLAVAPEVHSFMDSTFAEPGMRMRAFVETLAHQRGMLPPLEVPGDDDVIDPYRQSDAVYAESAQQLVPAVNATVNGLLRAVAGRT